MDGDCWQHGERAGGALLSAVMTRGLHWGILA